MLTRSANILLLLCVAGCAARTDPARLAPLPHSLVPLNGVPKIASASVAYDKSTILVTSPKGVALIAFHDPFNNGSGVSYRYRVLDDDSSGAEVRGNDDVYLKVKPTGQPGLFTDAGSRTAVRAGAIQFDWTSRSAFEGWIYYEPSRMQMKVANASEFETLDLRRAARPTTAPSSPQPQVASRNGM